MSQTLQDLYRSLQIAINGNPPSEFVDSLVETRNRVFDQLVKNRKRLFEQLFESEPTPPGTTSPRGFAYYGITRRDLLSLEEQNGPALILLPAEEREVIAVSLLSDIDFMCVNGIEVEDVKKQDRVAVAKSIVANL